MSKISRTFADMQARKRKPKIGSKAKPVDPVIQARAEAKALRGKVARLTDENYQLRQELTRCRKEPVRSAARV